MTDDRIKAEAAAEALELFADTIDGATKTAIRVMGIAGSVNLDEKTSGFIAGTTGTSLKMRQAAKIYREKGFESKNAAIRVALAEVLASSDEMLEDAVPPKLMAAARYAARSPADILKDALKDEAGKPN